ncbi:glycosyltransferase [Metabacillus arenae]|uniref:Glycosyltransferase n=1 Tax=Metabacillus arenae TaxID=2771434 RepID=A0A926NE53_9BACI|nr:glycosyltransferase [Metabacillus arenae]MBD1381824.1 glycosyltransferase [Metabacillus arenae]
MISIVTCTNRHTQMDNVFHNFTHQDWEEKELIVVLNGDEMNIEEWRKKAEQFSNVNVYQLPSENTLGECLNYGVTKSNYDIIAKFDDDDYYSPYYVPQAMTVFQEKQADIVGKKKVFTYFQQNQKLGIRKQAILPIAGPTIMFRKKVFHQVQFPKRNIGEDKGFLQEAEKQFEIYTTNPYNYVYIRSTPKNHTWQVSNERLMKKCFNLKVTDDYISHTTQPLG